MSKTIRKLPMREQDLNTDFNDLLIITHNPDSSYYNTGESLAKLIDRRAFSNQQDLSRLGQIKLNLIEDGFENIFENGRATSYLTEVPCEYSLYSLDGYWSIKPMAEILEQNMSIYEDLWAYFAPNLGGSAATTLLTKRIINTVKYIDSGGDYTILKNFIIFIFIIFIVFIFLRPGVIKNIVDLCILFIHFITSNYIFSKQLYVRLRRIYNIKFKNEFYMVPWRVPMEVRRFLLSEINAISLGIFISFSIFIYSLLFLWEEPIKNVDKAFEKSDLILGSAFPSYQPKIDAINFKILSIESLNFTPYFYADGLSIYLILLTTLIMFLTIVYTIDEIEKEHQNVYLSCIFLLELLLILAFTVTDILAFYIFFEAVLIPMFFMIGFWGSRSRKIKASYYFFLYTLMGSLLMLLAIIYIYLTIGSTDVHDIIFYTGFTKIEECLLWVAFFIALAVKIPMFPLHIWLPEAHVEAPTGGSAILAALLLKLGGYGMLRFLIPFFPYATEQFTSWVYTLSLLGVIYASFTTLRQNDLKRIIAYSSVAHMSFVVLGLFSINTQGLEGAYLLMLGHGLVSSALFFLVGHLYRVHGTRLLQYYGGVAMYMPLFASYFLFFSMANLSFPGTSNFVGEFLISLGIGQNSFFVLLVSGFGIILSAAYSMWLYNRVAFGEAKTQFIDIYCDMGLKKSFVIIVLIILTIALGIYSEPVSMAIKEPIANIIQNYIYKLNYIKN